MAKPDSGTAVKHEDPATQDEDQELEETEAAAPQKTEPKAKAEPERRKEEDRAEGPTPGTPRWNEVYGKWKDTERRLKEREADVDAIREHNRNLEARLNVIEASKADKPPEPEPDPAVDPDAYKKWHEMKRLQERQDWEKQRAIDRHESQVEMQKELHPDYLDVIKGAERDMAKDPELKKKIWGSPNPAKAAYVYGKARESELQEKSKEEQSREKARKQTETETSGEGGSSQAEDEEPSTKLTAAEERVVRNLFGDDPKGKEKYIKQKKAMGR